MSNPLVSVIVPTYRAGGLDVLFRGLRQQELKDFELILIDGLYPWRKDVVRELSAAHEMNVSHIERDSKTFWDYPVNAFQSDVNAAVERASSNILLFLGDYAHLGPKCVLSHYQCHQNSNRMVIAPMRFLEKRPHIDFPKYYNQNMVSNFPDQSLSGGGDIHTYMNDIKSGRLDQYKSSIYDEEFDGTGLNPCPYMNSADVALGHSVGPCHYNLFHYQNDSFKKDSFLGIGGADIRYDGTNGWQDSEIAYRLSSQGIEPYLIQEPIDCINPRAYFPRPIFERDNSANCSLYNELIGRS